MRPGKGADKVSLGGLPCPFSSVRKQSHLDLLGPPKGKGRFTTFCMVKTTVLFFCSVPGVVIKHRDHLSGLPR